MIVRKKSLEESDIQSIDEDDDDDNVDEMDTGKKVMPKFDNMPKVESTSDRKYTVTGISNPHILTDKDRLNHEQPNLKSLAVKPGGDNGEDDEDIDV